MATDGSPPRSTAAGTGGPRRRRSPAAGTTPSAAIPDVPSAAQAQAQAHREQERSGPSSRPDRSCSRRAGPGLPISRQVSREGAVLHRSEHHGDATPGSAVRIEVSDVVALQREFEENTVYPLRIGIDHQSWSDDLDVPDPFGNRLVFHSPTR
ncbi:glyoxalase superfamily protein [Curtobacterium sp. SP.BCo]|uniref:glyoxalase superfamily protein n=1 Tax=Curtobacterium sp. SP.BCo TaxID=3435229 RepID=UPI003F73F6A4